jgi:hypothetical protein
LTCLYSEKERANFLTGKIYIGLSRIESAGKLTGTKVAENGSRAISVYKKPIAEPFRAPGGFEEENPLKGNTVTNHSISTPLATLQAAGIITAEHCAQALAHPYSYALPEKRGLVDHLVWMIEHNIIDEKVLDEAIVHVLGTCEGDEQMRHMATIEEAYSLGLDALHKTHFRRLVHAGWITQAEYDRALAAIVPKDFLLIGAGRLLLWLIGHGIIDKSRVTRIRAMGNPDGDNRTAEMLVDVAQIFDRRFMWSGRGRIFLLITLLLAIVVAWEIFQPAPAPHCSDIDTKGAIEQLFSDSPGSRMDFRKPGAPISTPIVESTSEVGYASAPRVRACKAVVQVGGRQVPFAFTIAPAKDEGGFAILGAQPAIIEARFGNIDADGNYGNDADPLGRAEVERALRSGVDNIYRELGFTPNGASKRDQDMLNDIRRKLGQPHDDPDRAREIAEVEPLGPCRPVQADKVYSCRLLVERNDRLFAVLNHGASLVLDGEFTFERAGLLGQWRTTKSLPGELAKATMAAESAQARPAPSAQQAINATTDISGENIPE